MPSSLLTSFDCSCSMSVSHPPLNTRDAEKKRLPRQQFPDPSFSLLSSLTDPSPLSFSSRLSLFQTQLDCRPVLNRIVKTFFFTSTFDLSLLLSPSDLCLYHKFMFHSFPWSHIVWIDVSQTAKKELCFILAHRHYQPIYHFLNGPRALSLFLWDHILFEETF